MSCCFQLKCCNMCNILEFIRSRHLVCYFPFLNRIVALYNNEHFHVANNSSSSSNSRLDLN